MQKKQGNIGGFLYQKTKEHPSKRFSTYWDIPEFLLLYAYNDVFLHGDGIYHAHTRLNATLSLIGKDVSRDRFDNFVAAAKKYRYWQEKILNKKQQSTLILSKDEAESQDLHKKHPLIPTSMPKRLDLCISYQRIHRCPLGRKGL